MEKAMDTTDREIYWLVNMGSMNVFTPKRLSEMANKGWYIQSQHIVSDKRWFGRYCWVRINKRESDTFTYERKSF